MPRVNLVLDLDTYYQLTAFSRAVLKHTPPPTSEEISIAGIAAQCLAEGLHKRRRRWLWEQSSPGNQPPEEVRKVLEDILAHLEGHATVEQLDGLLARVRRALGGGRQWNRDT